MGEGLLLMDFWAGRFAICLIVSLHLINLRHCPFHLLPAMCEFAIPRIWALTTLPRLTNGSFGEIGRDGKVSNGVCELA